MNLKVYHIIKNSFVILLLCSFYFPSFTQLKIEPQNLLLPSGETAIFKAASSNKNFQYQWLKNGTPIEGAIESTLSYENAQLLEDSTQFQLIAKNETRTLKSNVALLRVTSNNRPYPSIRLSSDVESYAAGDTIFFEGDVTDIEEGVLKASAFTWSVELYQNDQLYSITTPTSGIIEGYFVIPRDGKLAEDTWYRITLVGTDSEGLSQHTFHDVFPEKTQFELITFPKELKVKVEGKVFPSPHLVNSIKGREWNIAAPKLQQKNGKLLVFTEWSDGFTEAIYPLYADESFLLGAIYEEVSLNNGTGLLGRYFESEENDQPTLIQVDDLLVVESDTVNHYARKEWIGEVMALVSDWHEFEVASDGKTQLYVDNQLLINEWNSNEDGKRVAKVQLERGKRYPIHLEVKHAKTLALFWSTPDLPRSLVPNNQLFPASDEGSTINLKHNYDQQKGILNLQLSKFDAQQERINIRILGTQGRTFLQQQFFMGKGLKTIDLDMRFFIPGVYFLEVRGGSFRKVIKVPKR